MAIDSPCSVVILRMAGLVVLGRAVVEAHLPLSPPARRAERPASCPARASSRRRGSTGLRETGPGSQVTEPSQNSGVEAPPSDDDHVVLRWAAQLAIAKSQRGLPGRRVGAARSRSSSVDDDRDIRARRDRLTQERRVDVHDHRGGGRRSQRRRSS
jgi:hypothetical protein